MNTMETPNYFKRTIIRSIIHDDHFMDERMSGYDMYDMRYMQRFVVSRYDAGDFFHSLDCLMHIHNP